MRRGAHFALAAFLFASACGRAPGPPRPAGLPRDAVWVRGASQESDGRFIACTVEPQRNVNRCRVYRADGKLDCERDFRVQLPRPSKPGSNGAPDRMAQRSELDYLAWREGDGILLRGGKMLKPLMACDVED